MMLGFGLHQQVSVSRPLQPVLYAKATGHPAPFDISSPSLAEITCDCIDVMKAIKRLRHNTASGPNGISATMLKGSCSSICGRLACLFNASFSSGKVPSAWKNSNVTPIHKKGDASLVQNYRPISLLSLVGKLQERLVHNLLLDHLLGTGVISPSQFGFRPCSSTQEALLSATQTWHKHMEDGFSTVCVFLDLSKAFDSVTHQGVFDALAGSGVCGSLLVWFCDYLTERSQRVVLQGSFSHSIAVPSGVPQGSILGPSSLLMGS